MLGFVSALSSAVAVMILIMTTLLINLGTTMLAREKALKSIQIDELSSTQHNQNEIKKHMKIYCLVDYHFQLAI